MIAAIALGVFVFVALTVGGWRALDTLAAHKARKERRPRVTPYTGPRYNAHGREVTSDHGRRIV